MRQEVHELLTFINSFLIREFNEYRFNSLSTKDFVTFEIIGQVIQPSDAAEKDGIYPTIRYVAHYFTKLKECLADPHFNFSNRELNVNLVDVLALLKEWVKQAIDEKIALVNTDPSQPVKGLTPLYLSASELRHLHFICDGCISLIDRQIITENTALIKFRALYDSICPEEIRDQLNRLNSNLYTYSLQITAHYRNILNGCQNEKDTSQWAALENNLQQALNISSVLEANCTYHISELEALKPSLQNADLDTAIENLSSLAKELDEVHAKFNTLKLQYSESSKLLNGLAPLVHPFLNTHQKLDASLSSWKKTFKMTLWGLFIIDAYVFIAIPIVSRQSITDNPWFTFLIPISLAAPFIWLAWLACKSYIFETRLKYQYLDKATIASAYNTYVNSESTDDVQLRKNTLKHLLKPVKVNWGKESASPFEAILKNRAVRKFLIALLKDNEASLKDKFKIRTGIKPRHKNSHDSQQEASGIIDAIAKDPSNSATQSAPASRDHPTS